MPKSSSKKKKEKNADFQVIKLFKLYKFNFILINLLENQVKSRKKEGS
jgi:hypothetical protein